MHDDVEYVRAPDGIHLACRVRGAGPIDLLEIGGFGTLFPMDGADEQPRWHRFEERLSRFCRLIRFDPRGIGASDQPAGPQRFEDWVTDALAVLDHVGSDQAAVLASSYGGFVAIRLAALHPDRVSALVLANSGARFSRADDYPIGVPRHVTDEYLDTLVPGAEEDTDIDAMAPSLALDADACRWWARTARRGASPATARAMWAASLTDDVRGLVAQIVAPTAVIRTTENRFIGVHHQVWLADHIPGARLIDIPAADHVIWAVPNDLAATEIEEFLTGTRSAQTGLRSMLAVLFTDIVDSTSRNAASGDEAWRDLLARHDALTETEIRRRGGRLVKRLGDGLLAVFPLASDALDTALAITTGAAELELGVRAAVHAAEVEEVDGDVLGLGVTVAARVLDHADGGEVVVTQTVVDLLTGAGRSFDRRSSEQLKGVPGEWPVSVAARD